MKPVKSFIVKASLPEPLESLRELVYNIGWYWNAQAINLLYRLDRSLWEEENHNPVSIIGSISQSRLESLAKDEGVLAQFQRVKEQYDKYMTGSSWYSKNYEKTSEKTIAYFSLEFGLAECIPIYSGGLGILAGDHLKSASDLGLPFVGMGLLYQEGFFRQYLNNDGWQQELYIDNDFYNMPVMPVLESNGSELKIELEYPDGPVYAKVWKIQVGRVPLFLLDTNIAENNPQNKRITATLYGGDNEMRIKQEILLGIGGFRALHAMDIYPTLYHMNEGHAAFLALERIRELMEEEKLTFGEAFELASAGNVFTTHTPVPAGHDRFTSELMLKYFQNFYPELGLTPEEFLGLGRINPKSSTELFCMTVLALKCADKSNAVSRLHMQVSKNMWKELWSGFPVDEIPVSHITNGVHISSWISHDMVNLFDRYLGPRWETEPASESIWERTNDIPDEEIWRTHEVRCERLVTFARKRLQKQLEQRGASDSEINIARGVLNSKVLTIGFARRFATYKRADLIFRDIDRLTNILTNPERPVQLIIAGKAHPRDDAGKAIIRKIVHYANSPKLRLNIVYIGDYDMNVARYLVQGVDVWLNTPRRPLEASGTSGMKAAANGALNISVLDGWWEEAYTPEVGWAIGSGEVYDDPDYQDEVESNALYNILEKEIVPLFYDIGEGGIPRKWIEKMKNTMSKIVPFFNTHRMVHEYFNNCYMPSIERFNRLKDNGCERARKLALWKQNVIKNWSDIKIVSIDSDGAGPFEVGGNVKVTAKIILGKLVPEDVSVELYAGSIDASDTLVGAVPITMKCINNEGKNYIFEGNVPFVQSGRIGFSLRVLPSHPDMALYQDCMLIKWA